MTHQFDALDREMLIEIAIGRRAEIERLKAEQNRPWLGLATTRELLDELRARIEMHALGGLDYRTVDGEEIAEKALELDDGGEAPGIARAALEPKP